MFFKMYILSIPILNSAIALFESTFINTSKLTLSLLVLSNKESNCLLKSKLVLEFVLESLSLSAPNISIRIGGTSLYFLFVLSFLSQ